MRLKTNFEYYAEDSLKKNDPDASLSLVHRVLCRKLQEVADSKTKSLMVFMPSGSGKTTILSRKFPAWLMQYSPGVSIIGCSHNGDFAETQVSKYVQDNHRTYADVFGTDRVEESKRLWRTDNGASYRAAGAGAGILGERADIGIIDDPFGNIADAKSPVMRSLIYNWYRSDFISRLKLGTGRKILMHQRLHQDDLAGRLLEEEEAEWDILFAPAVWEGKDWHGNACEDRWLGRQIGESVWPELWTPKLLSDREQEAGPYAWASMYQQVPSPVGGGLFRVSYLRNGIIEPNELMPHRSLVRAWDIAATANGGDYTVGVLMQANKDGTFTILDMVRGQFGPEKMQKVILDTARSDKRDYGYVKIVIPKEPAAAGVVLVASLIKMLQGFQVEAEAISGSKEVRANPFAAQVNNGTVNMVAAPWNKDMLSEFESFPGRHDDIVDAAASAFTKLTQQNVQKRTPKWSDENLFGV